MFFKRSGTAERAAVTPNRAAPPTAGEPKSIAWPVPAYGDAPLSEHSGAPGVEKWYHPTVVTASMIGERSCRPATVRSILDVYAKLTSDEYVETLQRYYTRGLDVYGDEWRYSDLVSAAYAAAELIRPQAYLEIGVRRGRSMAAVAAVAPQCQLLGFDRWTANYAGMENPGADFVREEMRRLGHSGSIELVSGNSHQTVPEYLARHPDAWFDIITVDGDHSPLGAAEDLACVLPRLRVGGAVLFDDISHPKHLELADVWRRMCGGQPRFSHWEYEDLGYGIGVAVRKY